MKAAQIPKPGADFEIVEREIPKPGPGEVRIKIQACGVCHSDVFTKEGSWPGIQYPRVPGHEVVGTIDELGLVFPGGNKSSESGLAGMAATMGRVSRANAEIFATAGI
jgi:D-arabinose 1-dehydrogenase-like Zn-dependent alcohol dehydrogenase